MEERKLIKSPNTERANRVPPGQRVVQTFPVLHYGAVHRLDPATWTLEVYGLVEKQIKLSFRQFVELPQAQVLCDIHCVTGWSRLGNLWEGVSTGTIRELLNMLPEARYAIVHGAGRFSTNLSLSDFFQPDVLLAVSHDGAVLSPEHGYPVRLVVPRLYFWKSAKWVTGIEFVKEDRPGFWESHGYHNRGDPWLEERYS